MTLGTGFAAYEIAYRQQKLAEVYAAANGHGRQGWRRRRQHGLSMQVRPSARPATA